MVARLVFCRHTLHDVVKLGAKGGEAQRRACLTHEDCQREPAATVDHGDVRGTSYSLQFVAAGARDSTRRVEAVVLRHAELLAVHRVRSELTCLQLRHALEIDPDKRGRDRRLPSIGKIFWKHEHSPFLGRERIASSEVRVLLPPRCDVTGAFLVCALHPLLEYGLQLGCTAATACELLTKPGHLGQGFLRALRLCTERFQRPQQSTGRVSQARQR